MNLIVHENGSYDIDAGGLALKGCFPGIDGKPVRPLKVEVCRQGGEVEIRYELMQGCVFLRFITQSSGFVVNSGFIGLEAPPYWFHPIFEADMAGVEKVFRQGFGIGGPSGCCVLEEFAGKKERIESYGLISLFNEESRLFMAVTRHDRFISRFDADPETEEEFARRFKAGFKLERTCRELQLPPVHIFTEDVLEIGLERAASLIAREMDARKPTRPLCHFDSWYYAFERFSHKDLQEHLEGFSRLEPAIPLEYLTICACNSPSVGDWLDTNEQWPEGLEIPCREIMERGWKPGIWISPYMVASRSRLYKEHPDWVLMGLDGKPVIEWKMYGEQKVWGYRDEEYYVLDTSHPEAMEYIRNVLRTYRRWGIEFYKADFMLWGIKDSCKVKRYTPGKTSIEYFTDLLKVFREEIGEESYLLGCIAPYFPFIGYADGMRIAFDVCPVWSEGEVYGFPVLFREIRTQNYYNHIFWQNDGDVIQLREFHNHLTEQEIKSLTLLEAMSGGLTSTSDPLHAISGERLDLFRFVIPGKLHKPVVPYLEQNRKEVILVQKFEGRRFVILIFNPAGETLVEKYPVRDLIGEESAYLRVWNSGEFTDKIAEEIFVRIPARESRLFFAASQEVLDKELKYLWAWE